MSISQRLIKKIKSLGNFDILLSILRHVDMYRHEPQDDYTRYNLRQQLICHGFTDVEFLPNPWRVVVKDRALGRVTVTLG